MKKIISILFISFALVSFIGIQVQKGRWIAPASAKKIKNPVAIKKRASAAKKGAAIFKMRCVVCHGKSAHGDGPGSKALNPKPANLTSERVQQQTDGEIFWKITNGRNGMIKWGPILSEKDRWNLVNFVRTLKNK